MKISITTSETSASDSGRRCTVCDHSRQRDGRSASPRAARRRARRLGLTSRWPNSINSAGSAVSDAVSTISTARIEAIERPYMNVTPVANIPSSAITTVVPASRTARPDVSIASITDSAMSGLAW